MLLANKISDISLMANALKSIALETELKMNIGKTARRILSFPNTSSRPVGIARCAVEAVDSAVDDTSAIYAASSGQTPSALWNY